MAALIIYFLRLSKGLVYMSVFMDVLLGSRTRKPVSAVDNVHASGPTTPDSLLSTVA